MKEERGITLIVLVITVIVLLILAGVAIASLTNNNMINRAQQAKDSSEKSATNELSEIGQYEAAIRNKKATEEINQYGFYYNTPYVCDNYSGPYGSVHVEQTFKTSGDVNTYVYQESNQTEGSSLSSIYDYTNAKLKNPDGETDFYVASIEYDHKYEARDVLNQVCYIWVDSNGDLNEEYTIPSAYITISDKQIVMAGMFTATFSNDGQSFDLGGNTFSIN